MCTNFGSLSDEHVLLDEFAYNNSYQASIDMTPFEALQSRPYRSPTCWLESEQSLVASLEMLQDSHRDNESIRQWLMAAQDRQYSYVDQRHHEISFIAGDPILLKVSPTKGTMRFGKRGKLRLRYVGPFEVLELVRDVAYKLALSPNFSVVFYVSLLRRYVVNQLHQILFEELELHPNLSYEEDAMRILDHCLKTIHQKVVTLVKILSSNHGIQEETWECEDKMRQCFPYLFASAVV